MPIYLIKPFRDEALAVAEGDVLEPVEVAARRAGLTCRRAGRHLELECTTKAAEKLVQNVKNNPESSTVYMDNVNAEFGACPAAITRR